MGLRMSGYGERMPGEEALSLAILLPDWPRFSGFLPKSAKNDHKTY